MRLQKTVTPCPVCGSRDREPILRVETCARPEWLLRCLKCRLVQPEQLPKAAELQEYYSRYSYDHQESWSVDSATQASLTELARSLRRYRTSGRLLDVGCGAGAVLRTMSADGWLAEGQEISAAATDRLEEEGFRIHREALEQLPSVDATFDVVVMSEVIEHLPAPDVTLRAVYRLLRPGGALYLTTPNFGSLSRRVLRDQWRAIDLPGHLSYFDRRSLKAYLARAGFSEVSVWSEGLNPYELIRGHRPQQVDDRERLRSQTERLRIAAAGPGIVRAAKRFTNLGLRLCGLGDTLKALAVR
jgi:2-polyprenyl-3-methyl-5-hydroxy-6-metoxy-1,4-benzoquinol methylase